MFLSTPVYASTLISYWKFDECSGNTAYDSSGYGNNGTLYNFTDGWVSGKYNCALEFNSTAEQFVYIGNDTIFNFGDGNFSLGVWVKTETKIDYYVPLSKYQDSPTRGFTVYSQVAGGNMWFSVAVYGDSDDEELNSNNVETDKWYYITFVRAGDNLKLYINGSLEDSVVLDVGNIDHPLNLFIGGDVFYGYWNGTIDEVRIWNGTLTDDEVENLYFYNSLSAPLPPAQPVTETMRDVGSGIGGLLSGMGTPVTVLIILLGVASAVGFVLASIGQRVGMKV